MRFAESGRSEHVQNNRAIAGVASTPRVKSIFSTPRRADSRAAPGQAKTLMREPAPRRAADVQAAIRSRCGTTRAAARRTQHTFVCAPFSRAAAERACLAVFTPQSRTHGPEPPLGDRTKQWASTSGLKAPSTQRATAALRSTRRRRQARQAAGASLIEPRGAGAPASPPPPPPAHHDARARAPQRSNDPWNRHGWALSPGRGAAPTTDGRPPTKNAAVSLQKADEIRTSALPAPPSALRPADGTPAQQAPS